MELRWRGAVKIMNCDHYVFDAGHKRHFDEEARQVKSELAPFRRLA
jgi:hypothetical protein